MTFAHLFEIMIVWHLLPKMRFGTVSPYPWFDYATAAACDIVLCMVGAYLLCDALSDVRLSVCHG